MDGFAVATRWNYFVSLRLLGLDLFDLERILDGKLDIQFLIGIVGACFPGTRSGCGIPGVRYKRVPCPCLKSLNHKAC